MALVTELLPLTLPYPPCDFLQLLFCRPPSALWLLDKYSLMIDEYCFDLPELHDICFYDVTSFFVRVTVLDLRVLIFALFAPLLAKRGNSYSQIINKVWLNVMYS